MIHKWKLGPQRIRDPSVGEIELLCTDMSGDSGRPLLIRYRTHECSEWNTKTICVDGRNSPVMEWWHDLMPPKMTKEHAIEECINIYMRSHGSVRTGLRSTIEHYLALQREGRVEE